MALKDFLLASFGQVHPAGTRVLYRGSDNEFLTATEEYHPAEYWCVSDTDLPPGKNRILLKGSLQSHLRKFTDYSFPAIFVTPSPVSEVPLSKTLVDLRAKLAPEGYLFISICNASGNKNVRLFNQGELDYYSGTMQYYSMLSFNRIIEDSGYYLHTINAQPYHEGLEIEDDMLLAILQPATARYRNLPADAVINIVNSKLAETMEMLRAKQHRNAYLEAVEIADIIRRVELPQLSQALQQCESLKLKLQALRGVID